jgi:hypothetical protein
MLNGSNIFLLIVIPNLIRCNFLKKFIPEFLFPYDQIDVHVKIWDRTIVSLP